MTPEVEPEDWEGCTYPYPEHEWTPGDIECRRCGADLAEWSEDSDQIVAALHEDRVVAGLEDDDNWRGWRDVP